MFGILRNSLRFALALSFVANAALADGIGDVIPADAKVVIAAHNLKATDEHVRAFADAIGVPLPPGIDVSQLSAITGLGDTWSLDQGAAVVIMEANEKGGALVFPVADAKAALAKIGGKEGDGEKVNFPPGQEAFALVKGKFLVISPKADVLNAFKAPAKTLGAEFTKDASQTDIYVTVNVAALRPMIAQGLQVAEAQIANLPLPPGQGDPEQTKAILQWYISGLGKMAQQMEGIYVSLTVAKDKLAIESMGEFTEGSYCAKNLWNIAKSKNVLKGVPAGPYMMAMGMDTSGFKTVMFDLGESMFSIPAIAKNLPADKKEKSFAAMKTMFEHAQGFGMTMSMGDNGMAMAGTYRSDSPEKLRAAIRDSADAMQDMMTGMTAGMSGKWNRRTVEGIEVDEFVYDFSKMPADQKKMMEGMYGPDSKMQIGIVNEALRFCMGSKEPILAFKASSKELSDDAGVQAVLEDLPKGAPIVALLDVFGFAKLITKSIANGPVPLPIPQLSFPETLPPPIGFALTGKKNSLTKDVVIRAETVKAIVTTVKKAMGQP